jgi:hypothetical protein
VDIDPLEAQRLASEAAKAARGGAVLPAAAVPILRQHPATVLMSRADKIQSLFADVALTAGPGTRDHGSTDSRGAKRVSDPLGGLAGPP